MYTVSQNTIRYDSVYLTCSKSLTDSQLSQLSVQHDSV